MTLAQLIALVDAENAVNGGQTSQGAQPETGTVDDLRFLARAAG